MKKNLALTRKKLQIFRKKKLCTWKPHDDGDGGGGDGYDLVQ